MFRWCEGSGKHTEKLAWCLATKTINNIKIEKETVLEWKWTKRRRSSYNSNQSNNNNNNWEKRTYHKRTIILCKCIRFAVFLPKMFSPARHSAAVLIAPNFSVRNICMCCCFSFILSSSFCIFLCIPLQQQQLFSLSFPFFLPCFAFFLN